MSLFISPALSVGVSSCAIHDWLDAECADAPWRETLDRAQSMFVVPLPTAPALVIAGCTFALAGRKLSATGVARSPRVALARMAAEIIEIVANGGRPNPMAGHGASEDLAIARRHAILELAERACVRKWWAGELKPSRPSSATQAAFTSTQRNWGTRLGRAELLFCLSDNGLPPVSVAWTTNRTGCGFTFGATCQLKEADAAVAALRELHQMCFGISLIASRIAAGAKINPADRARLDRAIDLDIRGDARFAAVGTAPPVTSFPADPDALVTQLQSVGFNLSTTLLTNAEASVNVFRAELPSQTPLLVDDPYGAIISDASFIG